MNEQQPYEKHLAEKFQQLPVPDVEPNWQQMKWLLDKKMPRGGGYWRWITGVGILLFMLGGAWLFISRQDTENLAGVEVNKNPVISKKQIPPDPSRSKSSAGEVPNKDGDDAVKNSSVQNNDQQLKDSKTKTIEENLHNKTDNKTSDVNNQINPETKDDSGNKPRKDQQKTNPLLQANKRSDAGLESDETTISDKKISPDRKYSDKIGKNIPDNYSYSAGELPIKNSNPQYTTQNSISDFAVDKLAGDSIKKNYSLLFPETVADNRNAGKASPKPKAAKSKALESVSNRTLALGLSLPMGFPLGDQKPGAYNINAKPNTVSDFLPAPHLQYHINNKVYLQTELQLMNPQYIQPVLLFQNRTEYPSTNTIHYNSVYAKKLYYFNIPVGIHYSPFEHFYLGTGLQFSSLVSGVAMHEETSFTIGSGINNLLSQRYTKFKNDSISDRIDNSEFRLMLDANYYWKQFTVGLRYNQALSNYVSIRLNNVSPLFQDKNKSLQFYLRYNLWEDYKRRRK
jgi:hypothetical protein